MVQAAETQCLSPRLWLWQAFDPAVKADLFSTAVVLEDSVYVIDPIRLAPTSFQELRDGHWIAGFLVTNTNHRRATVEFYRDFEAPIFCSAEVAKDLEGLKFV